MQTEPIEQLAEELTDTQRRMRAIQNADTREILKEVLPPLIREELAAFFKGRMKFWREHIEKAWKYLFGIIEKDE